MNFTATQLAQCTGARIDRVNVWLPHLQRACILFTIITRMRLAAFLAQVGHESGRLVYVREIWGPAQCPWQARYEGRADLGNTQPGDGKRYMGRGPIQITGRANYRAATTALRKLLPGVDVPDFEAVPELLEQPEWGALGAGWYWDSRNLNVLADAGDFDGISDLVNIGHKTAKVGDSNGWPDRLALYNAGQKAFNA